MSTQFGFQSFSSSPARQRILAAGRRYMESRERPDLHNKVVALEAKVGALTGRLRDIVAKERRRKIGRYRAFKWRAGAPAAPIKMTMTQIAHEVCKKRNVSMLDLMSHRKPIPVALARHEFCWRARHQTEFSLPAIGRFLGGRDHTTILHSIKKYQSLVDSGEES